MFPILSLKDLSINSKKVLMRVDFNVPQDKQGRITDATRIQAALPSLRWVLDHGGALILMSHLGRPGGKKVDALTLKPCAELLSEFLGLPVVFSNEVTGAETEEKAQSLAAGQILLLENLRFNPAEESPELDPSFAQNLAKLGQVYVDDAFGSAHRAHSSITEVPKYFAHADKGVGFLMEKEIKFLGEALEYPVRPFIAIVGGAKISTKAGILDTLSKKADKVLLGGAMALTLLKTKGISVGDSFVEELTDPPEGVFILPLDFVCEKEGAVRTFQVNEGIPAGWKGKDIGPQTLELFENSIKDAQTIFWNGPLGVFEDPRFAQGTYDMALAVARTSALSLIGGGETVAALEQTGLRDRITHVSTGGGASLEYLEHGTLPGIEALRG